MSLLKYEYICINCEEQFFVITKEDGSVPGFCPICSEPLEENSEVKDDG